jgi:hypothetical protein
MGIPFVVVGIEGDILSLFLGKKGADSNANFDFGFSHTFV